MEVFAELRDVGVNRCSRADEAVLIGECEDEIWGDREVVAFVEEVIFEVVMSRFVGAKSVLVLVGRSCEIEGVAVGDEVSWWGYHDDSVSEYGGLVFRGF